MVKYAVRGHAWDRLDPAVPKFEKDAADVKLGSGLIDQSQKITGGGDTDRGHEGVGAAVIAGVDAAQSLSLRTCFDLVATAVEDVSCGIGTLRLALDGMQAAMPRSARAVRNQSASSFSHRAGLRLSGKHQSSAPRLCSRSSAHRFPD